MNKISILFLVTLLVGCDDSVDWKKAMTERDCTAEQFEKVKSEAEYCNATTDYFGSFCLGTAMIRNCPVRVATPSAL